MKKYFMFRMGEASAVGIKSIVDCQQSAKYCCHLPSRLCDQLSQ